MLVKAPDGCAAANVTVRPRSFPPSVFVVESLSGAEPEKQTSEVEVELEGRVVHPTLHTCESLQLFCVNRGPEEH